LFSAKKRKEKIGVTRDEPDSDSEDFRPSTKRLTAKKDDWKQRLVFISKTNTISGAAMFF
jgi:hypothetical protein